MSEAHGSDCCCITNGGIHCLTTCRDTAITQRFEGTIIPEELDEMMAQAAMVALLSKAADIAYDYQQIGWKQKIEVVLEEIVEELNTTAERLVNGNG